MSIRLGIIGGGVMAEAILSRLLKKNIYSPETVLVSEPQSQRRNFWVNTYGVQVSEDNREAA
ncbi:MAG: pyrroline-5-carboxylate reductase family protein, partial [bacterium]